jgi:hypothetical protein
MAPIITTLSAIVKPGVPDIHHSPLNIREIHSAIAADMLMNRAGVNRRS